MPIELISTFRKKINTYFFSVLVLAIIVISLPLFIRFDNQGILVMKRILTYFLVLYSVTLYERRKNLFSIFRQDAEGIISSFEAYLEERKQKSHRLTIIRITIIGLLTIGIFLDLFILPQNNWSGFFFTVWLATVLLLIAEYWLNMNTHIMLQDLKHHEKESHSEISE